MVVVSSRLSVIPLLDRRFAAVLITQAVRASTEATSRRGRKVHDYRHEHARVVKLFVPMVFLNPGARGMLEHKQEL